MNLNLRDIIGNYEEPETINVPGLRNEVPIESPSRLDWTVRENPNRLSKMFKFSQESKFNAFILDILEHQAESQHHGRLTLQYPQIKIDIWTHSLNDVTEIDYEWAQAVNDIYEGYR